MKVLREVAEVSGEGFESLLGQTVTIFALNYIWAGKLVGVNETQVKLENVHIVYETGSFTEPKYKDAQKVPCAMYFRLSAIEAYGVVKEL